MIKKIFDWLGINRTSIRGVTVVSEKPLNKPKSVDWSKVGEVPTSNTTTTTKEMDKVLIKSREGLLETVAPEEFAKSRLKEMVSKTKHDKK